SSSENISSEVLSSESVDASSQILQTNSEKQDNPFDYEKPNIIVISVLAILGLIVLILSLIVIERKNRAD
ncbi:MAG: hypothetical protein RSE93_06380, partial [Oscillospiraceae bacterium]